MPTETPDFRAKRKYPIITPEQKDKIRQEILDMLKANPSLYLADLKSHLVKKYEIADQTAYMWLRHWSIA